MINKLILSLYDYYRKKDDPMVAAFHTKILLSVFVIVLLAIAFFIVSLMFNWEVAYNANVLDGTTLKIFTVAIFILIAIGIFLFTDSREVLESKRVKSQAKFRIIFFITYFIAMSALIYLIFVVS
jgi:hypothetical protein